MGSILDEVDDAVRTLAEEFIRRQQPDGSWRFCFENATIIDAYTIIALRTLEMESEPLIRRLHARILAAQQGDGSWRLYDDETEGNLAASIDAYYALLYSGCSARADEPVRRARRYIRARGGIGQANGILTKTVLAATGRIGWPASLTSVPIETLLLPSAFPVHFFSFSGYARVHLAPMLVMASRRFAIANERTPDLSDLLGERSAGEQRLTEEHRRMLGSIKAGLDSLKVPARRLREAATGAAERFMLQRIEADGTLYSYASCTVLMIFALLALGYGKRHPVIMHAVQGLMAMRHELDDRTTTIQNSPSTVWDTALIAGALQRAGTSGNHPAIRRAADWLLTLQHRKRADWSLRNPAALPGGWGFSETNAINPDVDDTTAALRALRGLSRTDPACREAWNRGLLWVLSMQNKDGGWPAFEKGTDNSMLTLLAIDGAKAAAIDPSTADLTGRTLEYLGRSAGLDIRHASVRRGADWLIRRQERDGSWYGRWGICYIYGTWAALTGLAAAGIAPDHAALRSGSQWLHRIQHADGGWGESCRSDVEMRYVPLGMSTPSQTAWALDALIAVHAAPTEAIDRGVRRLIASLREDGKAAVYPTGAALPGSFYVHYHSYRYIWPLLALSHYRSKYGAGG